jgi:hypothetical protein
MFWFGLSVFLIGLILATFTLAHWLPDFALMHYLFPGIVLTAIGWFWRRTPWAPDLSIQYGHDCG